MAVMKSFCGCMSVKSGTMVILAVDMLLYALTVAWSIYALATTPEKAERPLIKPEDIPKECNKNGTSEYKDLWWCWGLNEASTVMYNAAIGNLVYHAIHLIITIIAIYGATTDKSCPLLPAIILGFINWLLLAVGFGAVALVLMIYNPGKIELTTTISITAAAILFLVLLLYFWLCLVSHYQALRELESLAKDQVTIMQGGDIYPTDVKSTDPHYDDIPTDRTSITPPPAYSSPDMSKEHMDNDIPEIEDIKLDDPVK
eukprot:TRINITY_DN13139_c0_g1_i12.p1 TRINITY_DN13139_c0_g1~~TRINITY_DN13139_c0_g1_i12.p1  ORF type:complete len:258 (-),score=71.53 TRINITY_DN13139_c0_g1_i12:431-1204(-)